MNDVEEQLIRSALTDLSVGKDRIEEMLGEWKNGDTEEIRKFFYSARAELLSDLHTKQDKLYYIDYALKKLKLR